MGIISKIIFILQQSNVLPNLLPQQPILALADHTEQVNKQKGQFIQNQYSIQQQQNTLAQQQSHLAFPGHHQQQQSDVQAQQQDQNAIMPENNEPQQNLSTITQHFPQQQNEINLIPVRRVSK